MKCWFSILFVLFFLPVSAQHDPAQLANQLTASCKTDREKVKSIFKWITENISYRTFVRQKKVAHTYKKPPEEPEDTGALKPLNERVAEMVLKRKWAACDGYSRLFAALCDHAGIRCELIPGYAKNSIDRPGNRFGVNHYWNAVFFDSAWHLLDVTWASGYLNWSGDEFIRHYDEYYFLTPPELFVRDHYPDDLQWTLLTEMPTPKEFRYSPFKQKSFIKYSIISYYPSKGEIEASIGDTIRLQLEIADAERDNNICPDLLIDSTIFSRSESWVFLKPIEQDPLSYDPNKLKYHYPLTSSNIEWLYLMYNDDIVLRYKINMRKEKLAKAN